MPNNAVINDARVMSKGQVTIPKNIRSILGIAPGDRVTFVAEEGSVRVVNSVLYAVQQLKQDNKEQAEEKFDEKIMKSGRKTSKKQKQPSKKMAAFNRLMEIREEIAAANLPPIDEIRREAIEEKYGYMLDAKRHNI